MEISPNGGPPRRKGCGAALLARGPRAETRLPAAPGGDLAAGCRSFFRSPHSPTRGARLAPGWLTGAAMCHVWTAPSWQELSSRLQHWSVQPCVRPLDASVHMTAGHNALRESGPDQKLAFDNAMALVGCPDRADIGHDGQLAKTRNNLAQQFETLTRHIGRLVRQTGDVAARSRQGRDQAGTHRIRYRTEDNRYDRCRLLCRDDGAGSPGDDDTDLQPDELGRDFGEAFAASLAQRYSIATVRPSIQPSSRRRCTKAAVHRLMADDASRPRNPMVKSLTGCWAYAANGHAAARPRAFATMRLMTRSNLTRCSTGISVPRASPQAPLMALAG